jgi:hypothetical protein
MGNTNTPKNIKVSKSNNITFFCIRLRLLLRDQVVLGRLPLLRDGLELAPGTTLKNIILLLISETMLVDPKLNYM